METTKQSKKLQDLSPKSDINKKPRKGIVYKDLNMGSGLDQVDENYQVSSSSSNQ